MRSAALLLLLLAAAPATAQEAAIIRYCGGGRSGGGGGVMVDAEGRLYRLRQPTFATPREIIALPGQPAPVARWQALLDAARFEGLSPGQRGNMTCSLTRSAHGHNHSVQWPGTATPPQLPPELRQVIEEMTAAAR